MTEDSYRENILRRLGLLESELVKLKEKLSILDTQNAVEEVHRNNVEDRLTKIENNTQKLVWLVIAAILGAIITQWVGGF